MDDPSYHPDGFSTDLPARHVVVRPAASPLMFWVLTLLASLVFAPCVLVPVWQDDRALLTAGRLEAQAIQRMEADVAGQRRHANALRQDPMVVGRLARRDLAYTDADETTIPIETGLGEFRSVQQPPIPDSEPPAVIARLLDWIPAGHRLELYRDPAIRTTLMGLSGAVMVAAFVLFPPRRRLRG